jgi:hypothetical protein
MSHNSIIFKLLIILFPLKKISMVQPLNQITDGLYIFCSFFLSIFILLLSNIKVANHDSWKGSLTIYPAAMQKQNSSKVLLLIIQQVTSNSKLEFLKSRHYICIILFWKILNLYILWLWSKSTFLRIDRLLQHEIKKMLNSEIHMNIIYL